MSELRFSREPRTLALGKETPFLTTGRDHQNDSLGRLQRLASLIFAWYYLTVIVNATTGHTHQISSIVYK